MVNILFLVFLFLSNLLATGSSIFAQYKIAKFHEIARSNPENLENYLNKNQSGFYDHLGGGCYLNGACEFQDTKILNKTINEYNKLYIPNKNHILVFNDYNQQTPLHKCIISSNTANYLILLNKIIEDKAFSLLLDHLDKRGNTFLHYLIIKKNDLYLETFLNVLSKYHDQTNFINHQNDDMETPFFLSIKLGYLHGMRLLKNIGADLSLGNMAIKPDKLVKFSKNKEIKRFFKN